MEGLPKRGQRVRWSDPWFYDGEGIVLNVQVHPHHAVLVEITKIDDPNNQRLVGSRTWILPGHITEVSDGEE